MGLASETAGETHSVLSVEQERMKVQGFRKNTGFVCVDLLGRSLGQLSSHKWQCGHILSH